MLLNIFAKYSGKEILVIFQLNLNDKEYRILPYNIYLESMNKKLAEYGDFWEETGEK